MLGHHRIGPGEQHAEIGDMATGGPDLLAVDDPDVAVAHRARRESGEVRSRARLAEQLAPAQPAAHRIGDVPLDLLTGPVGGDGRRDEPDSHAHGRGERAEVGDRLRDAERVAAVQAAAVAVDR